MILPKVKYPKAGISPRGTYVIAQNITFPANVNLKMAKGAIFSVDTGITVTINGSIEAGLWQIFGGAGSIGGSPVVECVYPEWFGVISNLSGAATTNAAIINRYLNGSNMSILKFQSHSDYYIDDTLLLKSFKGISGGIKSRFILTTTNKDAIRYFPFALLDNFTIVLPDNHTKAGVKIDDSSDFSQYASTDNFHHIIQNIVVRGSNALLLSTGLDCRCLDTFNISNLQVTNFTPIWCYYGLLIDAVGTGWSNGNSFINIYPQACQYGIYNGDGGTGGCAGNRYIYTVQVEKTIGKAISGIYAGGTNNVYIGKVWDCIVGQF